MTPPAPVSSTAAAQASSAVSMARISMRGRIANGEWRIEGQRESLFAIRYSLFALHSHRPDFDHVGHEMPQEILDAVLQRCRRGRAAGAGALHVEINDAVLEAAEGDVAAIIGDSGAHPRLDQVLDGRHRIGAGLVE